MFLRKSTKLKFIMVFGSVSMVLFIWLYFNNRISGTTPKIIHKENFETELVKNSIDANLRETIVDVSGRESKANSKLTFELTKPLASESVKSSESHPPKSTVKQSNNLLHEKCDIKRREQRFDCLPENHPSKERCEERGCCWVGDNTTDNNVAPICHYPLNYTGYYVKSVKQSRSYMKRVWLQRNTPSPYPKDIKNLVMDVMFETDTRLHLKIYDIEKPRYEVPFFYPERSKIEDPKFEVKISRKGQPFQFSIARRENGEVLLNSTNAAAFIFSDQFIQLSYFLPSFNLYGLGEHRTSLLHSFNWTILTLWNRDHPPVENTNLYGSHPFYMMMEKDGKSHGVFFKNSNAMDVLLQPAPAITWRTIGGVIDLYYFLGPHPHDVVSQYTEVIGRPFLPPYWSLGFHLCRWGYKTAKRTLEIMDRVRKYKIPQNKVYIYWKLLPKKPLGLKPIFQDGLKNFDDWNLMIETCEDEGVYFNDHHCVMDVQWNDIEYAKNKLDFTTSKETFGDQIKLVEEIHRRGMHYVIITDVGISRNQTAGTYRPYDLGKEMDIFIKNASGQELVGRVWPAQTVFPDFTNPKTKNYWKILIKDFHSTIEFDGLWIDMNEISNFVNGSYSGCPENSTLENPPYLPHVKGNALKVHTICASAIHSLSSEYNVHNLYGLLETNATNYALRKTRKNKRPFIISRSTYPGQGHYGGHWTGDNYARFHDMYKSIPQILNFNLFGIPMVGADICGFNLNTTSQLCQRWLQLGAFYPFSRDHNEKINIDQDPGAFGEAVANSTAKAFNIRYKILPYLYTLFYKSHVLGHTVARPLFFEFQRDKNCLSNDKQFLLGPALLITPVFEENVTTVVGYFPNGTWYSYYTGKKVPRTGTHLKLSAPLDFINLHVRGGHILPMQYPDLTTTKSRKNPFLLYVALDSMGNAMGELFWDDGDSLNSLEKKKYNYFKFLAKNQTVTSYLDVTGYITKKMPLKTIHILGVDKKPSTTLLNNHQVKFAYNIKTQVLTVGSLLLDLLDAFTLQWF